MRKTQKGDTVRVHITGRLNDGAEFATTEEEVPMELTIDEDKHIYALQQGSLGMSVGEKRQSG
jgi:peptidylprolyl isomerase